LTGFLKAERSCLLRWVNHASKSTTALVVEKPQLLNRLRLLNKTNSLFLSIH